MDSLQHAEKGSQVRRTAILQSLWFVLGFTLVFVMLGASATWMGQWLLANLTVLGKLAGIIIIIFGAHYTGIIRIPFLMMDMRVETGSVNAKSGLGALVLGAAFAFGWTPCVGPILGAILTMAGAQENVSNGITLLLAYSVGLGIPFMLAALATNAFLAWSKRFKKHLHAIEVISGILLIIVGLLIFLGSFSTLSSWLVEYAPWLANIESLIKL